MGKSLYEVDLHKELELGLRKFVNGLNKAEEFRNKLIVDVISKLDEREYQSLKKEIAEKSSRLLKIDNRGQVKKTKSNALPTDLLVQNYFIAFYSEDDDDRSKIRMENDKEFLSSDPIKKEFVSSKFDFMKQKIIFYRADGAIIPYCIGAFDDLTFEREYNSLVMDTLQENSTSFNPHFDKELFMEMKAKDFKLKPEMQNEAMLYWNCGSFFG